MTNIELKLTIEQAQALSEALELYTRLRLGQKEALDTVLNTEKYLELGNSKVGIKGYRCCQQPTAKAGDF